MPDNQDDKSNGNPENGVARPFNGSKLSRIELPVKQVPNGYHTQQDRQDNTRQAEGPQHTLLTLFVHFGWGSGGGLLHGWVVFERAKVGDFRWPYINKRLFYSDIFQAKPVR